MFLFCALLIRDRLFVWLTLAWSLLNCYSRIYLGVHYPLDILCGLLCGAVVGLLVYRLCAFLFSRFSSDDKSNFISDQYTSTGYSRDDVNVCSFVLILCMLYASVSAVVC